MSSPLRNNMRSPGFKPQASAGLPAMGKTWFVTGVNPQIDTVNNTFTFIYTE